jgi:hypothetical protein
MVRAGVRAYKRWNYEEEEPENMVVEVCYAMIEAKKARARDDEVP